MVSIVIPVYNAKGLINDCLDSILRQNYPLQAIELVLIDDGSTDGSAEVLDEFCRQNNVYKGLPLVNCLVIHQENQGPAAARTRGIKEASGDYVFIVSQDCVAASDWVTSVVAIFKKDDQIGIVQGQILPEKVIDIPIFHCTTVRQKSFSYETAAIAYRASVLDKVGRYFDQKLSEFGDDTDLAWRILETGFKSYWLDKPTACHKVLPQPFFKEVKKAWGIQKFPLLIIRHPGLRKYLRLGAFWGGLLRPLRISLLIVAAVALVSGYFWITIFLFLASCFLFLVSVFKQTENFRIRNWQRCLVVLPHQFLTELVGSFALMWGAIRYRTVVL